jgi:E3 ubiquitin-protein ligase RAD18
MSSKNDVNISDPSDWLHTSLSSFMRLESALRCQVCKEFYNTPMITSCSHTFCSICIRKCLSSDGQCPTCRAGDQPSKLRRNWTVQELVETFQSARSVALELARKEQESKHEDEVPRRRKRKLADADMAHEEPTKQTRSRQTRSSARREGSTSAPSSQNAIVLDSEDDVDEEYVPEQPKQLEDGLVECPMCSRRMKEEQVFPHLDHCDGKPEPKKRTTKTR